MTMAVATRWKADELFFEEAEVLRALAHPIRIKILFLLREKGKMSVLAVAKELGISQSLVSQHLKLLRLRGLVSARREMVKVYYRVKNPKVIRFLVSFLEKSAK